MSPTIEVEVSGKFDSRDEAQAALDAMEDAVARHNGEIVDTFITDPEDEEE